MVPPPPVNASNLNDISNALQAVNITQQERTALGAQANDTLGQVLEVLKNQLNTSDSTIEELQTQLATKGNCLIDSGSYIGNGQTTNISITFNFYPDIIIIICSSGGAYNIVDRGYSYVVSTGSMIWVHGLETELIYSSSSSAQTYRNYSWDGNTFTWGCSGSYSYITGRFALNENGLTYRYIALKSV